MHEPIKRLGDMKVGLVLGLVTLLYGSGLGMVFGAFEEDIKDHLKGEGRQVLSTVYGGDEARMNKTVDKAWTCFKRAHLHANGLGTTAVALILLLSFLPVERRLARLTALVLGLGSLVYSLFWMFAGLRTPGMGSTDAARESLKWLAMPASAFCVIGLVAVGVLVLNALFRKGAAAR